MSVKTRLGALQQRVEDGEKAVEVARQETRERLAEHNNVEPKIRAWFEIMHEALVARVAALEAAMQEAEGRREPIMGMFKWIAGIIAIIAASWFAGRLMK